MRCAVTTVTTVITVAAGAFAPGHLGELTRVIPFELADAVLEEEGGLEKRVRSAHACVLLRTDHLARQIRQGDCG
jgi:hypothetical protein